MPDNPTPEPDLLQTPEEVKEFEREIEAIAHPSPDCDPKIGDWV